jgi:hypothetical protein
MVVRTNPVQNSDLGWEKASWWERLTKPGVQGHPVDPSNVTRICRAMHREDHYGHPQIVYYQNGLGSSWSVVDKFLGGGLAMGLSDNIRSAYGFLVNNYMNNDLIYFIGYSRGAFTARSTAGVVAKFGLLEKSSMNFFYEVFEDWEGAGEEGYEPMLPEALLRAKKIKSLDEFKLPPASSPEGPDPYLNAYAQKLKDLKMTREVKITAIGVFDTVGSLGLPVTPWLQSIGFAPTLRKYRFYDTTISNNVLTAFHALALDEHRSAFSPTLWEKPEGNNTVLKQVWFPGVHSNIGGGAHDTGMSDITLAWMMSQLATISAEDPKLNLAFNEHYLTDQVDANKLAYAEVKPPRHWIWGLGDLINSYTLPANMIGKHIRTPGNYPRLRFDNGKPTGEMLVNTHEYLHASVRARMKLDGKNYDLKTPYFPQALAATKHDNADALQKKWIDPAGSSQRWVFKEPKLELEEDVLGLYEKPMVDEVAGRTLFPDEYKASTATVE